jgi:hypothetical protein
MQINLSRRTMRTTAIVLSCSAASLFAADQWKPLFNGKDLSG